MKWKQNQICNQKLGKLGINQLWGIKTICSWVYSTGALSMLLIVVSWN